MSMTTFPESLTGSDVTYKCYMCHILRVGIHTSDQTPSVGVENGDVFAVLSDIAKDKDKDKAFDEVGFKVKKEFRSVGLAILLAAFAAQRNLLIYANNTVQNTELEAFYMLE